MNEPVAVGRDDYAAHLRNKRALLSALCQAAEAYLACELDAELKAVEAQPLRPQYPDERMDFPAALVRETEQVANIEEQIARLETSIAEGGPGIEIMEPMLRGIYLPLLQQQLEQTRERQRWIQSQIERGEQQ